MYTYRYIVKVNGTNRNKGVYIESIRGRTILRAQFDFTDETPPNMREAVASRIDLKHHDGLLMLYLTKDEGLSREEADLVDEEEIHDKTYDVYTSRKANFYAEQAKADKCVFVRRSRFSNLKFCVTATADAKVPLEQMLDLEGINKLILTGQFPEKNS